MPLPSDWSFKSLKEAKTIGLPPGRYWIGDLCYVLNDDLYDSVFGGTSYKEGHYTHANGTFYVAPTYAGDGTYEDTDGHEYPVDAGVLSIVSESLVDKIDGVPLGRYMTFPHGVTCSFTGRTFEPSGLFTFTWFTKEGTPETLTIDTGDSYEDEDSYDSDSE